MNSTRQIIDAALADNPLQIKNAIETVIGEKIASALEQKKVNVARGLMGETTDKSAGKDGPTHHPQFEGKSAHSKPPYHTKFSSGAGKKEEVDFEDFKKFLSDELQMELDDDDIEFLLEDMDQETFDEVILDYNQKLNESKKN